MSLWIEKLIPRNPYSRPGNKLECVKKVINHYTANPGASAFNHYKYFGSTLVAQNNKLPPRKRRHASAHIFVDKEEAYLIIPLDEVAYAANDGTFRGIPELRPNANYRSISVELCIEKDGTFHPETVKRAAQINTYLCEKFNLDPMKDIVRHYDVTRKNCPAPWVRNPQEFTNFKECVKNLLENKNKKEEVELYQPSNQAIKNATSIVLNRLADKDVHGDRAIDTLWREKFLKGELTTSDALGLIFVAFERGLL